MLRRALYSTSGGARAFSVLRPRRREMDKFEAEPRQTDFRSSLPGTAVRTPYAMIWERPKTLRVATEVDHQCFFLVRSLWVRV